MAVKNFQEQRTHNRVRSFEEGYKIQLAATFKSHRQEEKTVNGAALSVFGVVMGLLIFYLLDIRFSMGVFL